MGQKIFARKPLNVGRERPLIVTVTSNSGPQTVFLPMNNWDCSGDEKICAVDPASKMLQASGLTDCTMYCWMNSPQCLQFNYHLFSSPNCGLYYDYRPKNYNVSTDCQHYTVRYAQRLLAVVRSQVG